MAVGNLRGCECHLVGVVAANINMKKNFLIKKGDNENLFDEWMLSKFTYPTVLWCFDGWMRVIRPSGGPTRGHGMCWGSCGGGLLYLPGQTDDHRRRQRLADGMPVTKSSSTSWKLRTYFLIRPCKFDLKV